MEIRKYNEIVVYRAPWGAGRRPQLALIGLGSWLHEGRGTREKASIVNFTGGAVMDWRNG